MTIWFDMDGTLVDLYGVKGWLNMLRAEDTTPYEVAKPLLNFSYLARLLNKVQAQGVKIGIISWSSKNGSAEYDEAVRTAKVKYLRKHLASVKFDEINIIPYGTPKFLYATNIDDILFDDEKKNRETWSGIALTEKEIISTLITLMKGVKK